MIPPLWLLDVDGVLCPVGQGTVHGPHPHAHGASPAQVSTAAGLWVCWDEHVVQAINRLHADGLVDIRWVTTWGPAAVDLGRVLGLPELPVVHLPADAGHRSTKATAGIELLQSHPGRPFVWTDDHLNRSWRSMIKTALIDRPALLIQPQTDIGLTATHLRRIEAFARTYTTGQHP